MFKYEYLKMKSYQWNTYLHASTEMIRNNDTRTDASRWRHKRFAQKQKTNANLITTCRSKQINTF